MSLRILLIHKNKITSSYFGKLYHYKHTFVIYHRYNSTAHMARVDGRQDIDPIPDVLAPGWKDASEDESVRQEERTLQAGTWLFHATPREPDGGKLKKKSHFGTCVNTAMAVPTEDPESEENDEEKEAELRLEYTGKSFGYTRESYNTLYLRVFQTTTSLFLKELGREDESKPPKPYDGKYSVSDVGDDVRVDDPKKVLKWITTYAIPMYDIGTEPDNATFAPRNFADPADAEYHSVLARLYRATHPLRANADGITHVVMHGNDPATSMWLLNEIIPQSTNGKKSTTPMFVEPCGTVVRHVLTHTSAVDTVSIVSFVETTRAPSSVRKTPTSEAIPFDFMYPQTTRVRTLLCGIRGDDSAFSMCPKAFLETHTIVAMMIGWPDSFMGEKWITHSKCAIGRQAIASAIALFNSAPSLP